MSPYGRPNPYDPYAQASAVQGTYQTAYYPGQHQIPRPKLPTAAASPQQDPTWNYGTGWEQTPPAMPSPYPMGQPPRGGRPVQLPPNTGSPYGAYSQYGQQPYGQLRTPGRMF